MESLTLMPRHSLLGDRWELAEGPYRYVLSHHWGEEEDEREHVALVMLNPSSADCQVDDPTMRTVIRSIQPHGRWSGVDVLNLFAFRARDPRALLTAEDPVGPLNDEYLMLYALSAPDVICAWGNHGTYRDRHREVLMLLGGSPLWTWGLNGGGQPRHPLYMPNNTPLIGYRP